MEAETIEYKGWFFDRFYVSIEFLLADCPVPILPQNIKDDFRDRAGVTEPGPVTPAVT